jgi:hypothetical protein
MIIPPLKRLVSEDFTSQSSWIDKLIQPINQFFEGVSTALGKGLTFTDNFDGEIKTVETSGVYPIKIAWARKNRPKGVWVIDWSAKSGATPTITAAVQVQWSNATDGSLQIDTVVGITPTASAVYNVKILVITG